MVRLLRFRWHVNASFFLHILWYRQTNLTYAEILRNFIALSGSDMMFQLNVNSTRKKEFKNNIRNVYYDNEYNNVISKMLWAAKKSIELAITTSDYILVSLNLKVNLNIFFILWNGYYNVNMKQQKSKSVLHCTVWTFLIIIICHRCKCIFCSLFVSLLGFIDQNQEYLNMRV